MSKFEKLNVDIRKEQGTSAARRTRLQNKVPCSCLSFWGRGYTSFCR